MSLLSGSSSSGRTIRSLSLETEKMRVIKSENEIRVMRRAADISANAHAEVMKFTKADGKMSEHQLVAEFEHYCSMRGSARLAYMPVCAAGSNSTYLHYTANSALLQENDLVLFDAGCEFGGYASDITRTFPVSGKFTEPQRDLYTAVLRTLKDCVKMCSQRRSVNLYDLHEKSRTVLQEELRQLGMDFREKQDLFERAYAHFIGHPLGIDLHDAPTFQRHTRLDEGNVVTIEPGLMCVCFVSFCCFRADAVRNT
jgi:intermediate cleaving peptidase 55